MREEYQKWSQARLCSEDRQWSRLETIGDPSLHLPPMELHLVEKAFDGDEQVGTIRENREHQTVGQSVTQVGRDSIARVRESLTRGEGGET